MKIKDMKLVRESLKFERSLLPYKKLNIGKITLIKKWLYEMEVKDYTINEDFSIDVANSINLENKGLSSFPSYIKFNKVEGYFYCSFNQLTTLEGAPNEVGGGFYCENNQLTTLEGAPSIVEGNFSCYNNQLTSLEGAPSKVEGYFYCYNNIKKFTIEEVRKYCKVKGEITV